MGMGSGFPSSCRAISSRMFDKRRLFVILNGFFCTAEFRVRLDVSQTTSGNDLIAEAGRMNMNVVRISQSRPGRACMSAVTSGGMACH